MDEDFATKRKRVVSLFEAAEMPPEHKERYIRMVMYHSDWAQLKEELLDDLYLRGDLVEPGVHRLVLGALIAQIEAIE
ncbi:hypothetical protein [Nannocystis pusilla]|uniref:hypothetical protein n=1 Tax=Nannocystis pusilla TaxID=889268 RepID=UPI003BEFDD00